MGIAVIFYLISFVMFISSGIRAYASEIEYKRTGTRKTNLDCMHDYRHFYYYSSLLSVWLFS